MSKPQAKAHGVALINLGCRVNRVEIDAMAAELEKAGCVVCEAEEAAVVVVNTCAVTGEAETKTRKALRRALRLPQHPAVVATGCVASLMGERLVQSVPGIVVEPAKHSVATRCLELLGMTPSAARGGGLPVLAPTPTGRMRPGIKIQDGCDNRCSFCIVWKARGPSRSRPVAEIEGALREACRRGAHEVVLTGINLGNFRAGKDGPLGKGARLEALLEYLLDVTDIDRIRLSSIEPPDVSDELLGVMASSGGRVAPFLHVCLQSGTDATLRRMRRVYDSAFFAERVGRARELVPGMAIETDLIVGFPQETDTEFEASLAFCELMGFSRMHVFRYSPRPGTPAAEMHGQVDPAVKAARAHAAMGLAQRMRHIQAERQLGERDLVVVQERGLAVTSRLFDATVDESLPAGAYVPVRFVGLSGDVLEATGVAI